MLPVIVLDLDINGMWFQHDGAPPHRLNIVRNWLDNHFPGRWIGYNGPAKWPARSPDLSALDFAVWGYIHDQVYNNLAQPANMHELQIRVRAAVASITPQFLINVFGEYEGRLTATLLFDGGKFEHMLNQRFA